MLFAFVSLQFILYLLAVPALRYWLYDLEFAYKWDVAALAIASLVVGASLGSLVPKVAARQVRAAKIGLSRLGLIFFATWVIASAAISIWYGFYDRRIGTDALAEKFAEIPVPLLAIFRTLEISLPFVVAVSVLAILHSGWRNWPAMLAATMSLVAFSVLGAASSRTATIFFMIAVLVMIQNGARRFALFKSMLVAGLIGVTVFFAVSFVRLASPEEERGLESYVEAELVRRLDGLELISIVDREEGLRLVGLNPAAALNPLIASLPFLPEASQIKSEALTTVKSVALADDLGVVQRDYNSFISFDPYYVGGAIGLVLAMMIVGFVTRFVDRRILLNGSGVSFAFLSAITINLSIAEREFITVVLGTLRDFAILYVVLKLLVVSQSDYSGRPADVISRDGAILGRASA